MTKERNLRFIGTFLIIASFPIALILDPLVLNNNIAFLFDFLTILLWLIIVVSFKLEVEVVVDNVEIIIMPLFVYSIIMITFGAAVSTDSLAAASFIFLTISNVFCVLCWQFSLSIYKKQKQAYLVTGIGYIIITLIVRLSAILTLIPFFLFLAGFLLIIYAEYNMKKKGLLNYI